LGNLLYSRIVLSKMSLYKFQNDLVLAPKGDYAMNTRWILLISLLSLTLGSCGSSSQVAVEKSPDLPLTSPTKEPLSTLIPAQSIQGDNTQMNPSLPTPSASGLEGLIEKAKEDLAQRLGISVDSVTVAAVIGQEFSTDAFNCRTSKERIARDESPAVISGHSILLSASGRRYEYHASDQTVIFCRPLL
jgi:hypothetical protein